MKGSGFTLVEVLLSVALLGVITSLSLPVYVTLQTSNELNTSTQTLVSMLRRAHLYSRSSYHESSWGVQISSDAATLFKGVSYATRDPGFDERSALGSAVSTTWTGQVIFSKLTATPNVTGSISLSTSVNTRTITLNEKGMVGY